MKRSISIIVAVDQDAGFGKAGKIPWNYPEDLKHFQKITKGSVCIMGRKTYQDIREMRGDKPLLPNRDCFVVSHTLTSLPDANVTRTMGEAIDFSDLNRDVFIIGGERMFIQGMAIANKVYMTIIPESYDCDRTFPITALNKWFDIESGEESGDLRFMVYKRR